MRKKILIFLILLLSLTFLYSENVNITWFWDFDDFDVEYFRYQLDGEEDNNWTEVDSFTTDVTYSGLDGDIIHTLYLQQSYDGINWSPSAISDSYIIEQSEQQPEDDWAFDDVETFSPAEEELSTTALVEEIPITEEEISIEITTSKKTLKYAASIAPAYRASMFHNGIRVSMIGIKASFLQLFDKGNKGFGPGYKINTDFYWSSDYKMTFSTEALVLGSFIYEKTMLNFETGVEFMINDISPFSSSFGVVGGINTQIQLTERIYVDSGCAYHFQFGNADSKTHSFEIWFSCGYKF